MLCFVAIVALWRWKLPEPLLIAGGALFGIGSHFLRLNQ